MATSGIFATVTPTALGIPISDGSGLISPNWLQHGDVAVPLSIFAATGAIGAVLGAGLTLSLATQAANKVWAGPTSGTDAAPTFRALGSSDIPNLSSVYQPLIALGTTAQYWRGDKTWQSLDKTSVGLSNVENTALITWAGSSNLKTLGYATDDEIDSFNIAMWGDSLTNMLRPIIPRVITSRSIWNYGVGGQDSSQIATRMLAAAFTHTFTTIIWAGRNNFSSPSTVESDIASMVAALGANTKYVVLSVLNGSSEPTGSSGYTNIIGINSYLASTYPGHYLDIRSYLIAHGLSDAGITPTAQDITDIGNDVVPSSLRVDVVHLTTAGFTVVSNQIAIFLSANFAVDNIPVGSLSLPSSFRHSPPQQRLQLASLSGIYQDGVNVFHTDGATFNYLANGYETSPSGISNSGFGFGTLSSVTSGQYNTAIGVNALLLNTSGSQNTAFGQSALENNTTGNNNLSFGSLSLQFNTAGNGNIAIGYEALRLNDSGGSNIAIGYSALYHNTETGNLAIGTYSLFSSTVATGNIAFGYQSLFDITEGSDNLVIGRNSGIGITTGSSNTIIGNNIATLSPTLYRNIILANGLGAIKAQHDGSDWNFTGGIVTTTPSGSTAQPWKLGAVSAGLACVDIGGTVYTIAVIPV